MGPIRVLTFDCDGVMFDTASANAAYYNEILAHFDLPPLTNEQFEFAQMQTVDKALAHLFPDPEKLAEAHKFRKQRGYDPYIPYMEMDPDLIPLLEKHAGSRSLAVATNRSDTMAKVLKHHDIAHYFDLVVTALDVAHPKPHPDPLLHVLRHFGVKPGEMLYVGDSEVDQLAARSAEIPFVAVRNSGLDGDFHIQRLNQLDDVLERLK